jgi:hypothetical protein
MGGPGSGRRPRAVEAATAASGLSRVELEPELARCLVVATPASLALAEAIRAELAARTWQWTNPYAGGA